MASVSDPTNANAPAHAPAPSPTPPYSTRSRSRRWRSEERTLRGSVSRSRSANPSKSRGRPGAAAASPGAPKATATSPSSSSRDVEKGAGAPAAAPSPPWYRRLPKSPLIPLLRYIPLWLEGYIWGLIGGFVGAGCVIIIFTRATAFTASTDVPHGAWTAPAIVGSFGASAVLLYSVPASPLSQPRTVFVGQMLSSIVGVAITKLFALNSHFNINDTNHSYSLVWVAGALATGLAILVMQVTRTTHPPGGATAVLAATSPPVASLGWRYIPVVMLSAAVMVVWAVIWMNLGRKSYPDWWFFPPEKVRKTAFPGPELGAIVRKVKERSQSRGRRGRRSGNAKKQEGDVLPTANPPNAAGSEWKDEGGWQQQQQQQANTNGNDASAAAAPPLEAHHAQAAHQQALGDKRAEWARE